MRIHLLSLVLTIFLFGNVRAQDESVHAMATRLERLDNFKVTETRGCFSYTEALRYLELEELIDHSGPFTVFIPKTEAFDQASVGHALDKKSLYALTTYHLVAGKITAAKMLQMINRSGGKATLTTVEGSKLQLAFAGLDIVITDSAGNTTIITEADQNQGKGISHTISGVLLPQSLK
ncbi:fasciclin domain-containing protein [Sediminicola luteus]|uniref:FAS1 domain-containing protein n=1 Tax=Sediminicola luteus TaxID=319238 RepID=A0A2A4G422_9FLAO|nr:fasciclin domain-containing protein [Sediminicola luteus]PCE63699.1 hypothetical protein B7P33_10505 [Sediminicola luteus]